MPDVTGILNSLAAPSTGPSTKGTNLGKDDFLKLFITQLQHQDPLNPTDDKEFMGQMAQFSSLEQMTNVASSLDRLTISSQLMQGASLVGQQVSYQKDADSPVVTGTVASVRVADGVVLVKVGSDDVPMAGIQGVVPSGGDSATVAALHELGVKLDQLIAAQGSQLP